MRDLDLKNLPTHRRVEEAVARVALVLSSMTAAVMLAWLLWRTASEGLPLVDWGFLTSFPSRVASRAGVKPALAGSLWLAAIVILTSIPVGVLAGVYMNEYARPTRLTRLIRLSIANLAGVPSIVFGMLGLAIFVRVFGFGFVVLAGGFTLAILALPIIIVATEEALKAVPGSIREAAYGLGASKWQVTKDHVLPYALPGIMTGAILAIARAVGETAPLILVGGASAIFYMPDSPMSSYTALPLQTFAWATKPQAEFRELAAAGTVVLLAFILTMNLAAILIRNHYQKKLKW